MFRLRTVAVPCELLSFGASTCSLTFGVINPSVLFDYILWCVPVLPELGIQQLRVAAIQRDMILWIYKRPTDHSLPCRAAAPRRTSRKIGHLCHPNRRGITLTLILSLGLPLGSTKNAQPVASRYRCRTRAYGCLNVSKRQSCGKNVQNIC